MKRYVGDRLPWGCEVTVADNDSFRPLDPRYDLRNHSETGFEFGYTGSGPAQLALALLADALADDVRAQALYQDFHYQVIADIEIDHWQMTEEEIRRAVAQIEAGQEVEPRLGGQPPKPITVSSAMPGTQVDIPLPPETAECFGYRGPARYVGFYWTPFGDNLMFDDGVDSFDGQSWAFRAYRNHPAVVPLLGEFNLGYSDEEAEHCLLIDRQHNRAGLAPIDDALAFLRHHHPAAELLTPAEMEERERASQRAAAGWQEQPLDVAQVRRQMIEQRGRVGRLMSWLEQCPVPPAQGRGQP